MAEFVYAAGTGRFTLGPGFDSVRFPAEDAALPDSPIAVGQFEAGPNGDRIDLADWLEALTGQWAYHANPFVAGFLRLEQDGADTIVLVDPDGPHGMAGLGFVPWLRLEGVQIGALTPENLGYDPAETDYFAQGKTGIGGAAGETILGTATHDYLEGGGGDDRLVAGRGRDTLYGNDGDDWLLGEGEQDNLYGGAGADRIEGGEGDDSLGGDDGNDVLLGGDGSDWLSVGTGDDVAEGGAGDDRFASHSGGNDRLTGGAGNDSFDFWRGSFVTTELSRLEGGEGEDYFYVSAQNQGLIDIDAGTGSDRVEINVVHAALTIRFDPDGSDVVILNQLHSQWYGGAAITLEGFARGDEGGMILWHEFLGRALTNWDGTANPFATGHARIVTVDGRQILQIDSNAGQPGWVRVMDLGPAIATAFTAHNFDGFDPGGSAAVGAILAGTAEEDSLNGHSGSDTIDGEGGDDLIHGRSGIDSISGGGGQDEIHGGPGADLIDGGEGNDALLGGSGDDIVHGGEGNDRLLENWVAGYGGSDSLYGDGGDDYLELFRQIPQPAGAYYLSGGDGNDWIVVGFGNAGTATIDGGAGDDRITLSSLRFGAVASVTLGTGQDRLDLAGGRFHIASNSFLTVTDFAAGAAGDRIDFGNSGADWFSGWTAGANPFASGHFGLAPVAGGARLSIDSDGGGNSFVTLATLLGVDPLALTAFNLGGWAPPVLRFTEAGDQIAGTGGTDLIEGLGGGDLFLLQQGGDDAVAAGAGNDIVYFGAAFTADDQADGGDGRDVAVLQGNYYDLTLSDTNLAGMESISLQSGARTTWGDTANNFYDYDITMADSNVPAGVQLIVNAQSLRVSEDFTFDGSAETDGRYLVYGGHGTDDLTGGAGNDVFFFEGLRFQAGDRVDGGAGRDSIVISSGSGVNRFEFGDSSFTGIEAISVNNRFTTDPSQKPSYELILANGNVAAGATLIMNGSSLADPTQTVTFDGSAVWEGNLILFSGAGGDRLTGGSGIDLLYAAGGADDLTGGMGADIFQYRSASDSVWDNPDRILDFESGVDKIDLRLVDANTLVEGDQAFHWIGSAAFSFTAGELRVNESGGIWFAEADTDGDAFADLFIAFRSDTVPAAQGDFLL